MTELEEPQPPPAALIAPAQPDRWMVLLATLAGVTWAGVLSMLLFGAVDQTLALANPARWLFCGLVLLAGLLTFVPLQIRLRLPGLAFEGTAGALLLLYTLAFVPPPNAWLLSPPDVPVFVLFAAALLWFTSALALPIIFAISQRVYRQRARQYDMRRARRQAHEVGIAAAACVLLAGLRVLTPLGVLLVILITAVAELLILSYVEADA
jgi:hypothetical protein